MVSISKKDIGKKKSYKEPEFEPICYARGWAKKSAQTSLKWGNLMIYNLF